MCSTKKICWRLRIDADIKLHKNKTLFLNQQFRRKANYYYQENTKIQIQSKTGYAENPLNARKNSPKNQ